jgi:hypothetical protein
MIWNFRWLLCVLMLGLPTSGAWSASEQDISVFAKELREPLKKARYMEGQCTSISLEGWENISTIKCRYVVKDKGARKKAGLVVMANPNPEQLATWILNACEVVKPTRDRRDCAQHVFMRIIKQSGGQFPVGGVVYEDLFPVDGVFEAFGFYNGVTTRLNGLKHRETRPLKDIKLQAILDATPLNTITFSAPARIIGVTRDVYKKAHPSVDIDGLKWNGVVADEHKRALSSDRNFLLEAWLASPTH